MTTTPDHIDGKKFRIKKIVNKGSVILIETVEGREYTVTIRQMLERVQAVSEINKHINVLSEERRENDRCIRMAMQAIMDARKALGKLDAPESLKLFLATT